MTLRLTRHFPSERSEVISTIFSIGFRPGPTRKGLAGLKMSFCRLSMAGHPEDFHVRTYQTAF
jgi:hypothetical protein